MNFDKFWTDLVQLIKDMFVWCINFVIDVLAKLVDLAANLLPEYSLPLPDYNLNQFQFLSTFNWLFPTDTAITMVTAYAFSIGIYFTLGIITRWAKITN